MKINTKLLLVLLLVSLVPLAIISTLFYLSAKETITQGVLNHLESVAAIQSNRIISIVDQNIERLTLVSSRTQLRLNLKSFITSPNTGDQDKMNNILLDARSSVSSFQNISVLTLDGKVVASTDETRMGANYSDNDAYIRGQTENNADTFFLNGSQGLSIYLSGPLYLEDELLGVVIIESTADNIISSIQDYTGLGETGETLLASTDENGDAVFLTPTRFDENAALNRTIAKEELDSPTTQALLGQERLFIDTVDYRGEPVLAATRYIEEAGWGIVTKIDKAEALAPVAHLQYSLITIILISLALALIVSLFLSRVITRPIIKLAHMATRVGEGDLNARAEITSRDEIGILARACNQMKDSLVKTNSELERELAERKRTEEKYSTLVEQSNDGIIIIQDGLVKFANMKMVKMSGLSLDEITGSPFLNFVSPKYRALVMDRYQRRVSGEEVPNNYEIEIMAKDGRHIPVEINANRIEYEGKPADMAIVRDITERKRAEDTLRDSEERYRDLFDNTNDLIQSVLTDGHFLYVNKAWQNVLGYSEKEIANLKVWDIIHPDSMNHCMETFQKVMSSENISNIEAVFVAKDGSNVAVEGNAHSRFIDGKPISTQGIFRDVTARKKAEERIIHLNSLLRALRDVNQLITRESDRERLIQKSCDILVRTRGYERAWILLVDENRKPVSVAGAGLGEESPVFMEQMRSGNYPDCVKQLWNQENSFVAYDCPGTRHKGCILASIHSRRGVYRCKLENEGKTYGMLGVSIPPNMVADDGEKGLFLELCSDISFALATIERREEHKQAEEALRASEEKLRLMFESLAEGITVSDLNANIVQVNEAVVRMHGYETDKDLVGRSVFELIAEKDRARALENLGKTLKGEHVKDIEYTFLTREGREFPAELSSAILRDASGKPIGFIGITEDITERKKMEEQLIVTDRLASVGELASGIAHELNNPLTGVIGLSQLIIERDVPEDIKEDLKMVNSEAQRAVGVVKNLLTFARKHPLARQLININDVINKVLELRAYEQRVNNIQVVDRMAPDLPQIMADYFQLQQVFLNIIINAEHFMLEAHNKGTLTITTERVGDIVRASFADDGAGIPQENLGHIFDPFFTTKEVGKGTGLGLSICHGIVTSHGGRLYAESEPGKGATFIVELPIKQKEK